MAKNNTNKITLLQDIAGKCNGSLHKDYSGRGMCGEMCVAISCSDTNEVIEMAGTKGIRGARTDSLGKGYIVYWPNIQA